MAVKSQYPIVHTSTDPNRVGEAASSTGWGIEPIPDDRMRRMRAAFAVISGREGTSIGNSTDLSAAGDGTFFWGPGVVVPA